VDSSLDDGVVRTAERSEAQHRPAAARRASAKRE
jgi:hypothetical protein